MLVVVVEVVVVVTVVGDNVDVVVLGKTENITTDNYLKNIKIFRSGRQKTVPKRLANGSKL